jgi:transcriptional regulator with XRE-family HTH domain
MKSITSVSGPLDFSKEIGRRLRLLRMAKGLRQEDLAKNSESIHLGDYIWSTQSQSVSFKWSGDALAMTYRLSLIDKPNKGVY